MVGFATYDEVRRAVRGGQADKTNYKLDLFDEMAPIEERAKGVARTYAAFRELQTRFDLDARLLAGEKRKLRAELAALGGELDGYLAREYGIDTTLPMEFAVWRKGHQPFHWFIEFHRIMVDGGFDVIIGNPPYVEYRLARKKYTLQQGVYRAESAANLYAFCMERSITLLASRSRFGMIVPAGVMGLDDAASLREVLLSAFSRSSCSTFAIRPSKLFDGVDQRLCIYLGEIAQEEVRSLHASSTGSRKCVRG